MAKIPVTWAMIEGYKYIYRVSDQGDVQKQLQSGEWRTIKAYPYTGQWRVRLCTTDGRTERVQVSKLVVDAFMGGTPHGMRRAHKNGMAQDNAVENIIFLTPTEVATRTRKWNCRPVLKVDIKGNVVDIYSSASEAARANHTSRATMSRLCREVDNPYYLRGHRYCYEERFYRRKKHGEEACQST